MSQDCFSHNYEAFYTHTHTHTHTISALNHSHRTTDKNNLDCLFGSSNMLRQRQYKSNCGFDDPADMKKR